MLSWLIFCFFFFAFLFAIVRPFRDVVTGAALMVLGIVLVVYFHKEIDEIEF